MLKTIIDIATLFIAMLLVQVLLCNNIVLFSVAVPVVFIYFIIRIPMWLNRNLLLTLSFLLGFIIDIFSDTPGMNALSCTVLAMLKRPLFYAYMEHDDNSEQITPCIAGMGFFNYCKYLLSAVVIYCLMLFSIEYFSFADVKEIAIVAGSSSALTFLLLLGLDSLMIRRREKRL